VGKLKQHNANIASVLLYPRPLWKTGTTYRKMGHFFDIVCKQLSDIYGTTMTGCWQALRLQPGLAALLSWRMTMNHW
jgi:hypothetical protein